MNINELAREEKNRYLREWRKKNKDKVREYNRNYWIRKAKKLKEQGESKGE